MEGSMTQPAKTASAKSGKAPRKALAPKKAAKPKPPARPYKKTETGVLRTRIATMRKKLQILDSRAVILRDRLEQHEAEDKIRVAEEEGSAAESE